MKRRTFISLMSVMAAAGVLSLAGCSSNTSASTASSTAASASAAAANKLETIQSNGKLVIALEGAWQPWSFHDESDTLVGYDVEVSRAIAEKLGVEPEYVESDWDSLFAGLDAGRYDLVCNGVELSSGAVRNHDLEIMIKAFSLAGYSEEELSEKFTALYNAFQYGAPPHAGMAPGIDRMLMLLTGEENIREVIAFPMNSNAQDVLLGAPNEVSEQQLREVHIKLR
mgnify:CR=1 FL=1